MAGNGGTRACAGCEAGLPLYSVAVTALSEILFAPSLFEQKPEIQARARSVLFSCVFPSPSSRIFTPKKRSAEAVGPLVLREVQMLCLCRHLWLCPDKAHILVLFPVMAIPDLVLGCGIEWEGPEHLMGLGWCVQGGGHRNS